jgi:major membrane immunogen (membrane-anchored lipoprotein)
MRTLTTLSVLSATLLLAACSASDEGSETVEDDATEAPKLLSRFADLKKIRTQRRS